MKNSIKIVTIGIGLLFLLYFTTKQMFFAESNKGLPTSYNPPGPKKEIALDSSKSEGKKDYFTNDSIYQWNKKKVDWVAIGLYGMHQIEDKGSNSKVNSAQEPIRIRWRTLLDIMYRKRYFQKKGVEMFSPVFTPEILALNGKEIIIEGYEVPFDESGDMVALSANPYASCFFCGNASPASVISMFMTEKGGSYTLDAYRKFKGTLVLNYDDPDQFYYILKDTEKL